MFRCNESQHTPGADSSDLCGAGMFLNTQSGSVLLAACSRRELPAGLPFAHRLWDILLMAGAIPPPFLLPSQAQVRSHL